MNDAVNIETPSDLLPRRALRRGRSSIQKNHSGLPVVILDIDTNEDNILERLIN